MSRAGGGDRDEPLRRSADRTVVGVPEALLDPVGDPPSGFEVEAGVVERRRRERAAGTLVIAAVLVGTVPWWPKR